MRAPDWPAPEVSCRPVAVDDAHVPNAARLAYRKARKGGWEARLTYARGASMVNRDKDVVPGPVMETIALRLKRDSGEFVLGVATWEARARALCICGKSLLPTAKGLFLAHKAGGKGTDACAGSGQPAVPGEGAREYAFTCAYVTAGPGWWTTQIPEKVDATQLGAILTG